MRQRKSDFIRQIWLFLTMLLTIWIKLHECFFTDKTVFGVPLTVSLQRTGHALPKPIQYALNWLKNNALDQVKFIYYTH